MSNPKRIRLKNGYEFTPEASDYIRQQAKNNNVTPKKYIDSIGEEELIKILESGIRDLEVLFRYQDVVEYAFAYHFFLYGKEVSETEFREFLNEIYLNNIDKIKQQSYMLVYIFHEDYVNKRLAIKKIFMQKRYSQSRASFVLFIDYLPKL